MNTYVGRTVHSLFAFLIALAWLGCDQEEAEPAGASQSAAEGAEQPAEGTADETQTEKEEGVAAKEKTDPVEGTEQAKPIVVDGAGLQTPESVLYVPDEDLYLVSNVQGEPTAKDDNGFLSKIDPEGKVVELKWIDGADANVTLNAPKGTTIAAGVLYVADIDTVRLFDAKTGQPQGEIPIEGAGFINDITASEDGTIYVSDTGSLSEEKGSPDAVYVLKDGRAEPLMKDPKLGGPNGILADDKGVWVVAMRAGELYRINTEGERNDVQKLPKGGVDGIVRTEDGSLLISSWEASAVFRGKPGGEFEEIIEDVTSPADIGYDSKRDRVLIPIFQDNAVRIHPL